MAQQSQRITPDLFRKNIVHWQKAFIRLLYDPRDINHKIKLVSERIRHLLTNMGVDITIAFFMTEPTLLPLFCKLITRTKNRPANKLHFLLFWLYPLLNKSTSNPKDIEPLKKLTQSATIKGQLLSAIKANESDIFQIDSRTEKGWVILLNGSANTRLMVDFNGDTCYFSPNTPKRKQMKSHHPEKKKRKTKHTLSGKKRRPSYQLVEKYPPPKKKNNAQSEDPARSLQLCPIIQEHRITREAIIYCIQQSRSITFGAVLSIQQLQLLSGLRWPLAKPAIHANRMSTVSCLQIAMHPQRTGVSITCKDYPDKPYLIILRILIQISQLNHQKSTPALKALADHQPAPEKRKYADGPSQANAKKPRITHAEPKKRKYAGGPSQEPSTKHPRIPNSPCLYTQPAMTYDSPPSLKG